MIVAFECYADEDVVVFLRRTCKLTTIRKSHEGGQGRVVERVLEEQTANLGIVDEDPGRSHHRGRDRMLVVSTSAYLEQRRLGERHLIIIKPDLENCFRRCMERPGLSSALPARPEDLRRALGIPGKRTHETFQSELALLYEESKRRRIDTFVTELESVLRSIGPL